MNRQNPENQSTKQATFLEHADELRRRLLKALLWVLVLTCLVYVFIDSILAFIIRPVGQIVFTSPADAFVARINLSLVGGIILSMPAIIYQIWIFTAEGLKDFEKDYIKKFAPTSAVFFLAGVCFAYFIIIPIAVSFLLSFATPQIVPMITIKSYVSFIGTMLLAFGVVFELPLVLLFLTKIGVATPEFLRQKRKSAIMVILIFSALITPPDVITQILLAFPLVGLYELGIIFSKHAYKEGHKEET